MENENNKELLDEIKEINLRLKTIEEKLEKRTEGTTTSSYTLFEAIKWLLYGVFILGPVIAVIIVIIPLLFHWLGSLFRL